MRQIKIEFHGPAGIEHRAQCNVVPETFDALVRSQASIDRLVFLSGRRKTEVTPQDVMRALSDAEVASSETAFVQPAVQAGKTAATKRKEKSPPPADS